MRSAALLPFRKPVTPFQVSSASLDPGMIVIPVFRFWAIISIKASLLLALLTTPVATMMGGEAPCCEARLKKSLRTWMLLAMALWVRAPGPQVLKPCPSLVMLLSLSTVLNSPPLDPGNQHPDGVCPDFNGGKGIFHRRLSQCMALPDARLPVYTVRIPILSPVPGFSLWHVITRNAAHHIYRDRSGPRPG